MQNYTEFLNEGVLTKAEFDRQKNALNREIDKDFDSKKAELANKVGEEYRAERDRINKTGKWEYTAKMQTINDFPITEIPCTVFASLRKKIAKAEEFFPELSKKYIEFLDLWQPRVDILLGLKSSIGKREVLSTHHKQAKELVTLKYNTKMFNPLVNEIAEIVLAEFIKHNPEQTNTLEDIVDNLHPVKVALAKHFQDITPKKVVATTSPTVRHGDVNGTWKITDTDKHEYRLDIDTILAGGWNIQKLHLRTKVLLRKVI
jgi:hypothetical protein